MATDYDVIIAGGGMVGASLALALSRAGNGQLRVLVVESFLPASGELRYRPSFDARSSALAYGSRLIFESLDCWQALASHAQPIDRIHIGQRHRFGSVLLEAAPQGWPALGYVVENAWLGAVLMDRLARAPGISLATPARVSEAQREATGTRVTIERENGNQQLRCQLLAVADGAGSALRRQLGIATSTRDYGQVALIANVSCERPHRGCAYERFTDWGPMALLPLTNDEEGAPRAALVWTMSPPQRDGLLAASDEAFLQALQQRFGPRQGRFTKVGERHSYPLQLVQAREQLRSGIVVVGNAAHALHPVAGQGFNLALRDVQRLAGLLARAAAAGRPLGELPLLQAYRRQQADDQAFTTAFSDQLVNLFGRPGGVWAGARAAGLSGMDLLPLLKRGLADRAGGRSPGAPGGSP